MKRLLLIAAAGLLGGCDMGVPEPTIDYSYTWNFNVVNETAADIVVTDIIYPTHPPISISPSESERITDMGMSGRGGKPTDMMADILAQMTDHGVAETFHFTMTADGTAVSDEVWRRENWVYEAGLHESAYTLTVTDELLAQLVAE